MLLHEQGIGMLSPSQQKGSEQKLQGEQNAQALPVKKEQEKDIPTQSPRTANEFARSKIGCCKHHKTQLRGFSQSTAFHIKGIPILTPRSDFFHKVQSTYDTPFFENFGVPDPRSVCGLVASRFHEGFRVTPKSLQASSAGLIFAVWKMSVHLLLLQRYGGMHMQLPGPQPHPSVSSSRLNQRIAVCCTHSGVHNEQLPHSGDTCRVGPPPPKVHVGVPPKVCANRPQLQRKISTWHQREQKSCCSPQWQLT